MPAQPTPNEAQAPVNLTSSLLDGVNAYSDPAVMRGILDTDAAYQTGLLNNRVGAANQMMFGGGSQFDAQAAMASVTPEVAAQLQAEYSRSGDPRPYGEWMQAWAENGAASGDPSAIAILQNNQQYDPNSTVGQSITAGKALSQAGNEATSNARRSALDDVITMGGQLNDANRAANPELTNALQGAEDLRGSGDFYGDLGSAIQNRPTYDSVDFREAIAPQAGPANGYQAQGYSAEGYSAQDAAGVAPTGSRGYSAQNAAPVTATGSQGYQAALVGGPMNVSADQISAGSVDSGALGGSLYDQALGAEDLGETGRSLQGRANELASSTGQLTADELRNLNQSVREGYASRGTAVGAGAVSAEALARLTDQRGRMMQDLGMASSLNQSGLQETAANRNFRQGVQGQDLARQQQNVQNQFGADSANQGANLQAQFANQSAQQQTSFANQAAQNQAGQFGASAANQASLADTSVAAQQSLANQSAANQAGAFGASAANQASLTDTGVAAQQSLANQSARNQAGAFGAAAQNQAGAFGASAQNQAGAFGASAQNQADMANLSVNAQYGLTNQAQQLNQANANRNFFAAQDQQNIANLGTLGQLQQGQQSADRGYASNLAAMQQNASVDPWQALTGISSGAGAGGFNVGQQGFANSGTSGPQNIDPTAGTNLALMNAANQANYDANIFASQAGMYGAEQSADGAERGGLFQGVGSLIGGIFCWVAREVYGADNPKWLQFREWMFTCAPAWFFNLYGKYGERFAAFISNKPVLKYVIRKWMDSRIKTLEDSCQHSVVT